MGIKVKHTIPYIRKVLQKYLETELDWPTSFPKSKSSLAIIFLLFSLKRKNRKFFLRSGIEASKWTRYCKAMILNWEYPCHCSEHIWHSRDTFICHNLRAGLVCYLYVKGKRPGMLLYILQHKGRSLTTKLSGPKCH